MSIRHINWEIRKNNYAIWMLHTESRPELMSSFDEFGLQLSEIKNTPFIQTNHEFEKLV